MKGTNKTEMAFNVNINKPSYWTVQSVLRVYQELIKSNPIVTKSITSGVIAIIGSSISQVRLT